MDENIAVKPEFELKVTEDKLSVYVRLSDNEHNEGITVNGEDMLAFLANNGIKYGIMNDEIKYFCSHKNYFQWQKVAIGTRAIDGEDGSFALTFDAGALGPREREDGSIDYRELGLIKNVYEGEVLCHIVLPKDGVDGITVYGGALVAQVGRPAGVEAGNNVLLTDDRTELRAEKDGCVYFKGGKVFIEEAYSVKEDVSLKTGNIRFNGTIHIAQNVLQGFKVEAQKDIYVKGLVEGAELTAGGNIVIVGGVTGMNTAKIEAAGDVTAKFIENAKVRCGGNLTCDILLNSDVKVEKSVLMKGGRAAIIGGHTLAGERITAKTLGSDKYPRQEVTVRKNWRIFEEGADGAQEQDNRASMAALRKKLAQAEEYLQMYIGKIKEENSLGAEKNISRLKEYMVKKSELSMAVTALKNTIESYKKKDFLSSITCTGFIYPGVKINIDRCWKLISEEMQNQKFYVDDGEIVLGAVLPGER